MCICSPQIFPIVARFCGAQRRDALRIDRQTIVERRRSARQLRSTQKEFSSEEFYGEEITEACFYAFWMPRRIEEKHSLGDVSSGICGQHYSPGAYCYPA